MRTTRLAVLIFMLAAFTVSAVGQVANPAQTANSQSPQNPSPQTPKISNPGNPMGRKPPDMVCFGEGPKWSIQFVSWGARYLGINQPDRDFIGGFNWVPDQNVWVWQRQNGLAPTSGYGLSATIQKNACTDSTLKETFPYSAQVNLPEGDTVNGCCRKLKPGEAPVGPHGEPSNNTPTQ